MGLASSPRALAVVVHDTTIVRAPPLDIAALSSPRACVALRVLRVLLVCPQHHGRPVVVAFTHFLTPPLACIATSTRPSLARPLERPSTLDPRPCTVPPLQLLPPRHSFGRDIAVESKQQRCVWHLASGIWQQQFLSICVSVHQRQTACWPGLPHRLSITRLQHRLRNRNPPSYMRPEDRACFIGSLTTVFAFVILRQQTGFQKKALFALPSAHQFHSRGDEPLRPIRRHKRLHLESIDHPRPRVCASRIPLSMTAALSHSLHLPFLPTIPFTQHKQYTPHPTLTPPSQFSIIGKLLDTIHSFSTRPWNFAPHYRRYHRNYAHRATRLGSMTSWRTTRVPLCK